MGLVFLVLLGVTVGLLVRGILTESPGMTVLVATVSSVCGAILGGCLMNRAGGRTILEFQLGSMLTSVLTAILFPVILSRFLKKPEHIPEE